MSHKGTSTMWIKATIILAIVCLTTISIGILASLPTTKTPIDLLPNVKFNSCPPGPPVAGNPVYYELSHNTFIALTKELNITTIWYFYSSSDPKGTVYTFCMHFTHDTIWFWTLY